MPIFAQLGAAPHWRTIDFISDLHLQGQSATFALWCNYMQSTQADAVFILGDLFDAWVGDDAALESGSFESHCAQVLAATGQRLALFFMHGNRDFLITNTLADQCHFSLLSDPTVLSFFQQRYLLTHGDALCLADLDYQTLRRQVRTELWQQTFLARTLSERRALAQDMRRQSQAHQQAQGHSYADVDANAAINWLQAAQANTLIHGHTHRAAEHQLAHDLRRVVLSDWDASAQSIHAQVLRLHASPNGGIDMQRLQWPADLISKRHL